MKNITITPDVICKAKETLPSLYKKSRAEVLSGLKDILLKCPTSQSEDVMASSTREKLTSKMFTKKLHFVVDKKDETQHSNVMSVLNDIEFVSLTCDSEDFSNCMSSDIRINVKNKYNEWANTYVSSLSSSYLKFLYCLILEAWK